MRALWLALAFAASLGAQNLNFYLDSSNGSLPPSQLTPLPANYSFADTPVGSSASTVVRVVNSGTSPAQVSFLYIGSAAGSTASTPNFTVTGYPLGTVIAPASFKLFTLNFTPSTQGALTGYLQASVAGLPLSIATLSANGTPPAITLSCNSSIASQCSGSTLQPNTTAAINFGNVLTTAAAAIPFTLTNNGVTAVNPQTLISINTPSFNPNTPFSVGSLPATLAPGSSVTFAITFAPGTTQTFLTYLSVGVNTYALQGVGTASVLGDISSLTISYTDSTGVRLNAQPGTALSFGQVVSGVATNANTLKFVVANPQTTISAVTVPNISVTGAGFSISGAPSLPASIAPGGSIGFSLVFSPSATGTVTGTLSIGTRQFTVSAQAISSPLGTPSFALDVVPLVSGKQAHLSVNLGSAATTSAIGTLTATFTPLIAGITDDPAINFTATGSRQMQLTVASGGTAATYNGSSSLTFQSGATAGTLAFTFALPNGAPYTQSFTIAPEPVQILATTAVRQSPNLVVTVTGFDNTYSAGKLSFNFLDAKGKAMTAQPVAIDVTSQFHSYFFGSNTVGGAFSLQASFPVVGDVTTVTSVAVTLTNSSGPTTVSQTFQ